jgi:cytochrome P450
MQNRSKTGAGTTALDTFDPQMIARPHAFYAHLRANAPIVWIPQLEAWLLTRYDDVRTVLRDHEQWSSVRGEERRMLERSGVPIETVAPRGTLDMLGADRPDHTRLRKLLALDFTPSKIGRMQPRVDAITETPRHCCAAHRIARVSMLPRISPCLCLLPSLQNCLAFPQSSDASSRRGPMR